MHNFPKYPLNNQRYSDHNNFSPIRTSVSTGPCRTSCSANQNISPSSMMRGEKRRRGRWRTSLISRARHKRAKKTRSLGKPSSRSPRPSHYSRTGARASLRVYDAFFIALSERAAKSSGARKNCRRRFIDCFCGLPRWERAAAPRKGRKRSIDKESGAALKIRLSLLWTLMDIFIGLRDVMPTLEFIAGRPAFNGFLVLRWHCESCDAEIKAANNWDCIWILLRGLNSFIIPY